MMVSVDSIAKQSKKLLYDMDSKELKDLMMNLTRKYYLSYINDDINSMDSIKNKINEILVIYDDSDEIKHYFNYCIALNSNIIIQSIFRKDGELLKPFKTGSDAQFISLHERMKRNMEYFKALESEMMQE